MTQKKQIFSPVSEEIIHQSIDEMKFSDQDLIPAIAQQHDTGEVLMMAWMNQDSIRETLTTGRVCYWSRSRNSLWRKGETSGQVQNLISFRYDCDRDTILILVDQLGVACHTGRRNCFYHEVTAEGIKVIQDVVVDPDNLYPDKV